MLFQWSFIVYFHTPSTPQDEVGEAYQLLRDLEPTVPQEYILKGVVNAAVGQNAGSVGGGEFSQFSEYILRC